MKRLLLIAGTAVLISMGAATAASATTPDTTPPSAEAPATAGHPLIGTWSLVDVGDSEDEGFVGAFLSDGVYIEADTGTISIGSWTSTGENTAIMSYTGSDEDGRYTVRASITVDGDNLSADFTIEVLAEGAPAGEYGPGQVTGTRVSAEAIGTPVGTLDELFASFEEGAGSVPPTTG